MAEDRKPATTGQVNAMIRRRLRKRAEHVEEGLNIYPMMDMMTILLVFLVAQFASDASVIVQSPELQIPYSVSEDPQDRALEVVIARNQVMVANKPAVSLRDGKVDPSQKQGGSTGFLITPLLNLVQEQRELARQRDAARGREFGGEVSIIADRRTPYRTLTEVLYTLGQSEYKAIHFVVLRKNRE